MSESAPARAARPGQAPAVDAPAPPRADLLRVASTVAALALLALWVGWWAKSLQQDRLASGRRMWIPILPILAADFRVHIDHTARLWASGDNPYHRSDDLICALFPYPPMIPRVFTWVSLTSPRAAVIIWTAALGAIFAGASRAVGRTRRGLGLAPVPAPWLMVAVLYSTPVVTAMERGQCDPMVVPMLGLAAWLLRRRTARSDAAAGALLGLTAWIKYYPGLAVVALLALRRWRALALFVTVAVAIGLYDLDGVRRSVASGALLASIEDRPGAHLHPVQHAVGKFAPAIAEAAGWRRLARLPGPVASALLLGPAVLFVARRLDQARRRGADPGPLLWPAFLWLAAAATFALPYSNDYNLAVLPLAALCVWDRRDPVAVAMTFGLLVPWWQPLALPIDGRVLFVSKLLALYASGACLGLRASESVPRPAPPRPRPHLFEPRTLQVAPASRVSDLPPAAPGPLSAPEVSS